MRGIDMSQLVKGGKYVFAWSVVGERGEIKIPDEIMEEYGLSSGPVFILPGSKRSGGFAVVSPQSLQEFPLGILLESLPELKFFTLPEGVVIYHKRNAYCWVQLKNNEITLPLLHYRPMESSLEMSC
jgi:hypothetical protein